MSQLAHFDLSCPLRLGGQIPRTTLTLTRTWRYGIC